jgi:hypothetical protein
MNTPNYHLYELTPEAVDTLAPSDVTGERIGILVHDDKGTLDYRRFMDDLPVPCAALAFVTRKKLRPHRQMAACMGLSREHGCPCGVFRTPEQARTWLENRLAV